MSPSHRTVSKNRQSSSNQSGSNSTFQSSSSTDYSDDDDDYSDSESTDQTTQSSSTANYTPSTITTSYTGSTSSSGPSRKQTRTAKSIKSSHLLHTVVYSDSESSLSSTDFSSEGSSSPVTTNSSSFSSSPESSTFTSGSEISSNFSFAPQRFGNNRQQKKNNSFFAIKTLKPQASSSRVTIVSPISSQSTGQSTSQFTSQSTLSTTTYDSSSFSSDSSSSGGGHQHRIVRRDKQPPGNRQIVQGHRISIPFVPDQQVVPIDLALKNLHEILSRPPSPRPVPQIAHPRPPSKVLSRQQSAQQISSPTSMNHLSVDPAAHRQQPSRTKSGSSVGGQYRPISSSHPSHHHHWLRRIRCVQCGAMLSLSEPHDCPHRLKNNNNTALEGQSFEAPARESRSTKQGRNQVLNPQQFGASNASMPQFNRNHHRSYRSSSSRAFRDKNIEYDTEELDEEVMNTGNGYRRHATTVRRVRADKNRPCPTSATMLAAGDQRRECVCGCCFAQNCRRSDLKRYDVYYNCASSPNASRNDLPPVAGNPPCLSSSTTTSSLLGNHFPTSVMDLCGRVTRHLCKASGLIGHCTPPVHTGCCPRQQCALRGSQKPACSRCCCLTSTSASSSSTRRRFRDRKSWYILIIILGFALLIYIVCHWPNDGDDGDGTRRFSGDFDSRRKSSDDSKWFHWNHGGVSQTSDTASSPAAAPMFRFGIHGVIRPDSRRHAPSACDSSNNVACHKRQQEQEPIPSLFTYSRSTFQGLIK